MLDTRHPLLGVVLLLACVTECLCGIGESKFRCDFEKDLCGMAQHMDGNKIITRNRSSDADIWEIPRRPGQTGEFFLYEGLYNNERIPRNPSISTPLIALSQPATHCVRFWMFTMNKDPHEINVVLQHDNPSENLTLAEFKLEHHPRWTLKSIRVPAARSFRIMFDLFILPRTLDYKFAWAIDDLEIFEGSCSGGNTERNCNFEDGDCGYQLVTGPNMVNWTRTTGTLSGSNGPSLDSTYNSPKGHYMLLEYGPRPGDTEVLTSIWRSPAQVLEDDHCLSYFYQINTNNPWRLAALHVEVGVHLHSVSIQQGHKWVFKKITVLGAPESRQIDFYGRDFPAVTGYIAIDDVRLTPGPCSFEGSCNFGGLSNLDELCGWQALIDSTANMLWAVGKPITPAEGPASQNNMLYFYGGRGSGYGYGSRAVLYSPELDPEQAGCMTFDYFFNMSEAAEIRIYAVEGFNSTKLLWQHAGSQGSDETPAGEYGWRLGRVSISTAVPTVYMIEGIILQEINKLYLVALDNVQFLSASCSQVPASSLPRPTIEPPTHPAVSVCDFDTDSADEKCGFVADESPPFRWRKRNGLTPFIEDGIDESLAPSFDHTTLEDFGNYLYFQSANPNSQLSYAREISPVYKIDGVNGAENHCLRFWYQHKSTSWSTGELNVYVKRPDRDEVRIWTNAGLESSAADKWTLAVVNEWTTPFIGATAYQLIFEVKVMHEDTTITAALDDITVDSKECVPFDCDFEQGMCNWENEALDHFVDSPNPDFYPLRWEYGNKELLGQDASSYFHGLFLHVPISAGTPANSQAMLHHAELMNEKGAVRCFTFNFYASYKEAGYIEIVKLNQGKFDHTNYNPIWTSRDVENAGMLGWRKGQVMYISDDTYTIMIIAHVNSSNSTPQPNQIYALAIDDIKVYEQDSANENLCPFLPANSKPAMVTTSTPVNTAPTIDPNANQIIQSCSFDVDLCGFTIMTGDDLWKRVGRDAPDSYAFAVPDRNLGDADQFLYLEYEDVGASALIGSVASETVRNGTSPTDRYCVRFWMYMGADDAITFNILLHEIPTTRELVIEKFDGQDSDYLNWRLRDFTFETKYSFQIALSVRAGVLGSLGILAVDDFVIETGKCSTDAEIPPPNGGHFCNFEEDECDYVAGGDTQFITWTRMARLTTSPQDPYLFALSPPDDVTYHSEDGHFVFGYLGPRTDNIPSGRKRATYTSPVYTLEGNQCVSFYHQLTKLPDKSTPTLSLTARGTVEMDLWASSVATGKNWMFVRKTFDPKGVTTYKLTLVFEVSGSKGARGGAALDDISVSPGACENPGDCKFNTGSDKYCSWTSVTYQDGTPYMLWLNGMPKNGPPASSGYIYFEGGRGTPNRPKMKAVLYSEEIVLPRDSLCMSFMYFMNSSGAAVVRIHWVNDLEEYHPLWEHRGHMGSDWTTEAGVWKHAKVPLTSRDYIVKIEGEIIREVGVRYFMAIDEIQFTNQPCVLTPQDSLPHPTAPTPEDDEEVEMCSFDDRVAEIPMCGWSAQNNTTRMWKLQQGLEKDIDSHVPAFDHTDLESINYYLYFNSTGLRMNEESTVTSTSYFRDKPTDPRCVRFWYMFTGRNMGLLIVSSTGGDHTLFSRSGPPASEWSLATFAETTEKMEFKLTFRAFVDHPDPVGGIAIDDVSVAHAPCHVMDCNFAHGSCNWENYYIGTAKDPLDWEFGTSQVLPYMDDGTDRGYFMYTPILPSTPPMEAAFLRNPGLIQGSMSYCLHFEFMISTRGAGQLAVWLYWYNEEKNDFDYTIAWESAGGAKINQWQQGQIFLNRPEFWTVMIEALANPSNVSLPQRLHGIAVDNIRLELVKDADHCPEVPEITVPTTPVPVSSRSTTAMFTNNPTTPSPVSQFICNFDDNNFCGWTQKEDTDYVWKIGQAGSTGPIAGPIGGDNSLPQRDSYFIYTDAPSGQPYDKARLYSPMISFPTAYCVRFVYNMNGPGMGNINMFFVAIFGGDFNPNWTPPFPSVYGGNFGDQWIGHSFTVANSPSKPKSIVIEAVRGSMTTSYIAIDDISVQAGTCEAKGACSFEQNFCNYNAFSGLWNRQKHPDTQAFEAVGSMSADSRSAAMRSEILPSQRTGCFSFRSRTVSGLGHVAVQIIEYPNDTSPNSTTKWILGSDDLPTTQARFPFSTSSRFQVSIELALTHADHTICPMCIELTVAFTDLLLSTSTCTYLPMEANPEYVQPDKTTVGPTTEYYETIMPATTRPPVNSLSVYDCDFDEITFCLWDNNGQWRVSDETVESTTGPTSGLNGNGYFAYFRSYLFTQTGLLTSPPITLQSTTGAEKPQFYIFSFWYYMHGSRIKHLLVSLLRPGEVPKKLWMKERDQGQKWHSAQLVIAANGDDIRLQIEAAGSNPFYTAVIAVDELRFSDGKLPDQFEDNVCDFDTPAWCGYETPADENGFSWTWRNGEVTNNLQDDGPTFDKSQNTELGYYMAYSPGSQYKQNKLISTLHPPVEEACVKFYYYRKSRNTGGKLYVSITQNDAVSEESWSDESMIGGDFWEPVYILVQSPTNPWKIVWEAVTVAPGQPLIAIDHVVVTEGPCAPDTVFCSFDNDLCEWSNDASVDQMDWELNYGASSAEGTGPPGDALGDADSGYLLFDNRVAVVGDVARLISTPVQLSAWPTMCFSFWYNMRGGDVGELSVYQRNLIFSSDQLVWQLTGEQGAVWGFAQVSLTSYDPFQIVIQATRLYGVRGDIAIDEFQERQALSACQIMPNTAVPVITTAAPSTETTPGPTQLNCTFEYDTCGWFIEAENTDPNLRWRRYQAVSSPSSTAPNKDHTLGNSSGHYLLFEASAAHQDHLVRMNSGYLTPTLHKCLRFYYHAGVTFNGYLSVQIFKTGLTPSETIWQRTSPNEGMVWIAAEVNIHDPELKLQMVFFEALRGEGTLHGDVALDDISLSDEPCDNGDKYCDFEEGLCGFNQGTSDDQMHWILSTPQNDESPYLVPSTDVSKGTSSGRYLMTQRRNSSNNLPDSVIATPTYASNTEPECLQFFYWLTTEQGSSDILRIYLTNGGIALRIREFEGHQGIHWNRALATFYGTNNYSIDFRSTVNSFNTFIALDDIRISPGACRNELECDFDSDSFCGWRNTEKDDGHGLLDWVAVNSHSSFNGPLMDHSLGTNAGYYALADADIPAQLGDKAWLISPVVQGFVLNCYSFWFQKGGDGRSASALRVKARSVETNATKLLWRVERGQTGMWLPGKFAYVANHSYEFVFEVEIGADRSAFVAIDSIRFVQETCPLRQTIPEEASPTWVPPSVTTTAPVTRPPNDFEFTCSFGMDDMCVFENLIIEGEESPPPTCNFTLHQGRAVCLNSGPSSDHTLQNSNGTYLYFQSAPCLEADAAGAGISTKFPLQGFQETTQCLQFWYFMYGAPGLLVVNLNMSNEFTPPEFIRMYNQGRQWLQANVTISNPEKLPYYINFIVQNTGSKFGDVALDDISLRDGHCPSQKNLCDFENDDNMCNFTRVVTFGQDKFKWATTKVSDTMMGAFGFDHTFQANAGHVAMADGTQVKPGVSTYMVSPEQTRGESPDQCLSFWFLTLEGFDDSLSVHFMKAKTSNFVNPVWTMSNHFNDVWEHVTIPVPIQEDYKFAFEAKSGEDSVILLDDINIMDERCPPELSCDFEEGKCGWSNGVLRDQIRWIVFQGEDSELDNAGPSTDHTLGTELGHYIYIDNEYPHPDQPSQATLISSRIPGNRSPFFCFSFWYHMFVDSNSEASLDLMVLAQDMQNSIWSRNGSSRNRWEYVQQDLMLDGKDIKLAFQGNVDGSHGKSDIALDDFLLVASECPETPLTNYTCEVDADWVIPSTRVCDQKIDCPAEDDEKYCGGCDFKYGETCGYAIFNDDAEFTWEYKTKAEIISSSYAIPITVPWPPGSTAEMILVANVSRGADKMSTYFDSPLIHQTSETCMMTFSYFIFTESPGDPGAILVYLKHDSTETMIASVDRNAFPLEEKNKWHKQRVQVGRNSGEFQIIFRARKEYVRNAVIALADIEMEGCEFTAPTLDSACSVYFPHRCEISRVCIREDQLCDYYDNCGTREDEINCTATHPVRCDFDRDMCDWRNDNGLTLQWTRATSRSSTAYSGPMRDHTTGLKNGGFINLISSSNQAHSGKSAELVSRIMPETLPNRNCAIRYHYHMYGRTMGTLSVFKITDGFKELDRTATLLARYDGISEDKWNFDTKGISSAVPYRIMFQATLGGNSSDIALDDISFSSDCTFESMEPSSTTETPPWSTMEMSSETSAPTVTVAPTSSMTMPLSSSAVTSPSSTAITQTPETSTQAPAVTTLSPATTTETSVRPSEDTSPVSSIPCPSTWCAPEQVCLDVTALCDGHRNCSDGSDELHCVLLRTPPAGLGGGTLSGIVIGLMLVAFGGIGAAFWFLRKKKAVPDAGAGATGASSGYRSFGALDGVVEDETDNGNNTLDDFYSGDL